MVNPFRVPSSEKRRQKGKEKKAATLPKTEGKTSNRGHQLLADYSLFIAPMGLQQQSGGMTSLCALQVRYFLPNLISSSLLDG